jgi:uncharacterized membrane protein YdjX (TVP38/TMEM64 family)
MTAGSGTAGKRAERHCCRVGLTLGGARGQARAMSTEAVAPKRKLPWLKLAVVAVVLGVGALLVLRGLDVRALAERAMALVRAQGPVVFFLAMAILPGVGAPASPFDLAAGPAFGEQLGMPLVVVLACAALTVNMTLTYWLARRALRPVLERLMTRFGYKLPALEPSELMDLTIVMRVTPGMPFVIQNYLLGMARVPFGRYVIVSSVIIWIYTVGIVLFGDAVLHGKGGMAVVAVSVLVVAAVATHWVRKNLAKKKAAAS